MQTAIFAAGCFWGVQYYFDQVPGVTVTEAGYTGGHTDSPTYEAVCSHTTGHAEAVRLTFDSKKVSYETLVRHFFRMHDPKQLNRQGPDVGDNYRSAIFYANSEQQRVAVQVRDELNKTKFAGKIVTEITHAAPWWPAEPYHQKYAKRTGVGMCNVPYEELG